MAKKPKRFELKKGLYAIDSSGTAPNGAQLKDRSDQVFDEIKESYDSDAVTVISLGDGDSNHQPG